MCEMKKELLELIPTLHLVENPKDINQLTRVKQDLKLYDTYARKFLFNYGEKLNVDVSDFNFRKYFPNDIPALRLFRRLYRKKQILTLGELEQAIAYGKLNDDILAKIRENTSEQAPHKKLYIQGQTNFTFDQIIVYILAVVAFFIILSLVFVFFRQAILLD
jgi:hypothetical protein